jgi:glucose-6-phosphate-specific signal transduction histidine kinase
LFLSLFALDAFDGRPLAEALPDYLMHLVPAGVVLAAVALGWRYEWIGGVAFAAMAAGYAYWARDHVSWIAVISGPLLVVSVLFLASWLNHRRSLGVGDGITAR